jgi:hypothetical protein
MPGAPANLLDEADPQARQRYADDVRRRMAGLTTP